MHCGVIITSSYRRFKSVRKIKEKKSWHRACVARDRLYSVWNENASSVVSRTWRRRCAAKRYLCLRSICDLWSTGDRRETDVWWKPHGTEYIFRLGRVRRTWHDECSWINRLLCICDSPWRTVFTRIVAAQRAASSRTVTDVLVNVRVTSRHAETHFVSLFIIIQSESI